VIFDRMVPGELTDEFGMTWDPWADKQACSLLQKAGLSKGKLFNSPLGVEFQRLPACGQSEWHCKLKNFCFPTDSEIRLPLQASAIKALHWSGSAAKRSYYDLQTTVEGKTNSYKADIEVHDAPEMLTTRQIFNISSEELEAELAGGLTPLSGGGGMSGAEMFRTKGAVFLVKQVLQIPYILEEQSFLTSGFLKRYADYVKAVDGETLLCKYLLHFSVTYHRMGGTAGATEESSQGPFHYVIMASLKPSAISKLSLMEYDLKGSWRYANTEQPLKDREYFGNPKESFSLAGPDVSGVALASLTRDVAFLASNNIFDYSMVMFLFNAQADQGALQHAWHVEGSHGGQAVVASMAIVDIFTKFNLAMRAKFELGGKKQAARPPPEYAINFLVAIAKGVFLSFRDDATALDLIKPIPYETSPMARYAALLSDEGLHKAMQHLMARYGGAYTVHELSADVDQIVHRLLA